MTKRRPLALGAALTIGFSSLFFASPAMAVEADTKGGSAGALAAVDSAESFSEATGADVVAAGVGGGGTVIVVDKDSQQDDSVQAFADKVAAGEVEGVDQVAFASAAQAYAATDVVGGAGYIAEGDEGPFSCSIGFTGFDANGNRALITAGHCGADGQASEVALSEPSSDEAAGGPGGVDNGTGIAGVFGFAQHGGPGNTVGAEGDPTSTDIGVIDLRNPDLELHPEVTDWTTAADNDLAASTIRVRSVGEPTAGDVTKSGRTTGFTTGDTDVTLPTTDGGTAEFEILDGYIEIEDRWATAS